MTRVLVTGGGGFIGQHLVSELVGRGRPVRGLDVPRPSRLLPTVDYIQGSVLDADLVERAMDGVEQVYHLAGLPGMWKQDRGEFHDVNYGGTENVLAVARKARVTRVLHCSTQFLPVPT